MSSKQSTSKLDTRIAQKEAMVTRHKSAQMKRQLRDKNRSMKHLTDLLKSPSKETQTSVSKNVKAKTKSPKLKSLLKSVEKVQKLPEKVFRLSKVLRKKISLVQDKEYYPNKRKRKADVKKVMLKPSHDMQMVGSITGSVKRKCGVPLKAAQKPKQSKASSPVNPRLTMAEAIRIVEDSLTDEDMMEILTCPSPVWWEDPPDEEYIEDAIFTRSPPRETQDLLTADTVTPEQKTHEAVQEKMEVEPPPAADNDDKIEDKPIEITNLNSKGDRFLSKRSKLEGLLGIIKYKSGKVYQSKKDNFGEDLVVICSSYRKGGSNNNKDKKSYSVSEKARETQSESDGDEILFHDTSMNEDELLRDLENMDIPIKNPSRQSDVIVIDDDEDVVFLDNTADNSSSKEISSFETSCSNNGKVKTPKVQAAALKTYSNEKFSEVPKNTPFLQNCNADKEFSSPKSIDSTSSKTSPSSQDIDSISDTNIRFLLDDGVEEQSRSVSGHDKAEELKSNGDLNTGDSKKLTDNVEKLNKLKSSNDSNVGHGQISGSIGKPDILKSSNDSNVGHGEISGSIGKPDILKSSNDSNVGHGEISGSIGKPDILKSSNDSNVGHGEISGSIGKPDLLKSSNDSNVGHGEISGSIGKPDILKSSNDSNVSRKYTSDGLEKADKLESNQHSTVYVTKNIFDDLEKPDDCDVLNTSDAKNICDGSEKVAALNSDKGTGGHNVDSIESLKKYKNTSKKSITVIKIIEESDNSETDNSNVSKENGIDDKEEKSCLKINDLYKKCKKVYQKKSKKIEDGTDINKNLKPTKENETKFMLCALCKPKTKKVSDDKNVKYCLKCSSIFDSQDCTYCIEKSNTQVYTCVPCKIRFCCEVFYYRHAIEHLDVRLNSEPII